MSTRHQTQYSLRNDKSQTFQIDAEITRSGKRGDEGAEVTAKIQPFQGLPFTFVVEFGGEFVQTKQNFTPEMYLHTASSIVQSQIESKRYRDTLLRVHKHSGLTETSPLAR
jgi:hypothetical protein